MAFQYTFRGFDIPSWEPAARDLVENRDLELELYTTTIDTSLALKADIASPTLTGVPAAPTATPGTSTTQLATTAFVTTADALKANLTGASFSGAITATQITTSSPTTKDQMRLEPSTTGTSGAFITLRPTTLTGSRAVTFQDKSGTVAYTSDLITDPGYTTGDTYGPPVGTATTGNLTLSRTYYASFYLGKSVSFDRIGVSTGAGFVGTATVRLGIYNMSSSTGKPSTVQFDAGTASVTGVNTSTYITISQTLTAGWYFTAVNMQTAASTPTFRVNGPFQSSPFLVSYNDNANGSSSFYENSITGAFATAGTLVRQGTAICAGILRVA